MADVVSAVIIYFFIIGIGLELLFSFLLIFYILSATDPMRRVESANAALGVGLTVAVSHLCLVSWSVSNFHNSTLKLGISRLRFELCNSYIKIMV